MPRRISDLDGDEYVAAMKDRQRERAEWLRRRAQGMPPMERRELEDEADALERGADEEE